MKKWIEKGLNIYRGMSVQVRASMAFMVVNFMQKGISFLTAPIFTRLLTTEEYGGHYDLFFLGRCHWYFCHVWSL